MTTCKASEGAVSGEQAHEDFGGPIPDDWQWIDGHPFPPQWTSIVELPFRPRHNWGAVMVCDQCDRAWLFRKKANHT